jgi:Transposase DDE domain
MRHLHSSITPGVVHGQAREALAGVLDWKPCGALVAVNDLLDLLLMMAATATSLFAVVERFFSFCHQTARDAIQANLPDLDRLVQGLLDSLHETAQFSGSDRRRRWLLAIDTHYVPYYGKPNAYVVGGPKKQGTQWFFAYATAVLLHKGRRYTIALCPLLPKTKPHETVRTLLQQIADKGLKIRGVVLDSGFDSGETFLLLQERHLAYTVPLRRKGNQRNARNRLFEGRNKQVRWAEWNVKDTPRQVRTRAVLCKGGPRTMLLAFQGWNQTRAHNVHQEAARQKRLYQRRFGIETSYRQKNQAKAKTTSSDPVYRLLLEGLGYLLRQIWVVLTEQLRQGHSNRDWIATLPMHRLLDWLLHELHTLHCEDLAIPTSKTSYGSQVA